MTCIEMNKYYNFRKELHKLYNIENLRDDLTCKILEIRDRYRCINIINIDIKSHFIEIELDKKTSPNKENEIVNRISSCIKEYILSNINFINKDIINDEELYTIMNSNNYPFCDIILIGNVIKYNL